MDQAGSGAGAVHRGQDLRCERCGTTVRMSQVGGGRIECCDAPMQPGGAAAGGTAAGAEPAGGAPASVRCSGCGNEASVTYDGGSSLECCNKAMTAAG